MYIKKDEIIRMVHGINGAETIDYIALADFNIAVLKDAALRSEFKPLLDEKSKPDGEPFFGEYLREHVGCVALVKEPAYSVKLSGNMCTVHIRPAVATLSKRNSKV